MQIVYLIPSLLQEDGTDAIPPYLLDAISDCPIFFVENERTTRRYFKQLWKTFRPEGSFVIDDHEWHVIDNGASPAFRLALASGKNIGIVSEAGCPGVADPGQTLVGIAQKMNITVRPLVGPNSILLALMASGMNGQQFHFAGYLPIENEERAKAIKELETASAKKNCTEIFIETPYRNNQLFETLLRCCAGTTRICVAVDITGKNEWIKTLSVADWKTRSLNIHKKPAIFLLYAGQ
jgi:16S rRNA (cytidine1402-2'-O)-methyltransferase